MPTTRIDREALPYVRPAYEPDTRTLSQLLAMAGQARAQNVGRRGQVRAQGWMTLGDIISSGIQDYQNRKVEQSKLEAAALRQQQEDAFKQRDQDIRAAEAGARIGEREEAARLRQDAATRQAREDAQKSGDVRASAIGYGPMAESDVDTVMQSPSRAGDVQYRFGPGTADGPELMPTPNQQREIETRKAIQKMGGEIGPNGQVVMPPKPDAPTRPPQPTEWSVLMEAAGGDPNKALQLRREQQRAASSGARPQLTANAESALINRWAREWQAATKPEREIGRQIDMMDAGLEAAKRGDMAQANEAILQTFLKVLDPNSVVREGEFWRLQQGQSLINRIKAAVERVPQGGWVSLPELEKYARLAKEIQTKLAASTSGARRRIGASADRYGIPPELIFDDVTESAPTPAPNYLSNDPNAGEPIATPNRKGGR